jgi:hypothetical protein
LLPNAQAMQGYALSTEEPTFNMAWDWI